MFVCVCVVYGRQANCEWLVPEKSLWLHDAFGLFLVRIQNVYYKSEKWKLNFYTKTKTLTRTGSNRTCAQRQGCILQKCVYRKWYERTAPNAKDEDAQHAHDVRGHVVRLCTFFRTTFSRPFIINIDVWYVPLWRASAASSGNIVASSRRIMLPST